MPPGTRVQTQENAKADYMEGYTNENVGLRKK